MKMQFKAVRCAHPAAALAVLVALACGGGQEADPGAAGAGAGQAAAGAAGAGAGQAAADAGQAAAGGQAAGGGERERTESQSVPTSMLSEGGTSMLPPAQEFQLPELGFDFGSEDAPIKVVEFSDYGCGFCRRFHTETFPTLRANYIETGRVQWKYVTYVSGMFANGMTAAFAAECAGEQGVFEDMSRMLYERQSDWKGMGEPYPVFEELAREAGADTDDFRACITEQRPRPRVRSGVLSGGRLGVRGTPSFLVNGVPIVGARPLPYWEGLFSAIEEEIGEAGGAPGSGS